MGSPANMSLLAGLVKGYTEKRASDAKDALDSRALTQQHMLAYLREMAANPNVPPEHQQWAMQQGLALAQHDVTKPFPKGIADLTTLPPVNLQKPPAQQVQTLPGITPPTHPSKVGRQSNGEVNALGSAGRAGLGVGRTPPMSQVAPPLPPSGPVASRSMLQVPTPPSGLISQGPAPPPEQLAPGGQPHILTLGEKARIASSAEQEEINRLQQQYPDKSREELAYMAQHGEFPKPVTHTLSPGQQLIDERTGKVLATNTGAKPGIQKGLQFKNVGTTLLSMTDSSTGQTYNDPDDPEMPPELKQKWNAEQKRLDIADKKKQDEEDKKNNQLLARALTISENTAQHAAEKAAYGPALDAAKKAKPMVDIRDTQEEYMNFIAAGGQPSPRKDLALIVAAVRAMNPGTVRLPNKELELELKAGSYGDRLKRWYETATEGTLPNDQRADLFRVVNDETTRTTDSAREAWDQAFSARKVPAPSYLQKRVAPPQAPQTAEAAPEGATHEAIDANGNVVGHIVNGKYVPLQ